MLLPRKSIWELPPSFSRGSFGRCPAPRLCPGSQNQPKAGQSATEQEMREGKEEEGIEELSYSESVYLKIETTLH